MEKNKIRIIYITVGLFLSALLLRMLYPQIKGAIFIHDSLWFIPTLARETAGLNFIELIKYLLRPFPIWFEIASLKVYSFCLLSLFGPIAKNFILTSIVFHFICSILLFGLVKRLGLSLRLGFLSALMYLTLFAHFHAYIWPMAFQHLAVVFFILFGLNLYLKTEEMINRGGRYRLFFVLTLLSSVLSVFGSLSILILPAVILAHILFCSRDTEQRLKRYDLWLPLFIIYLSYPLIRIIVGDGRFNGLCRSLTPIIADNALLSALIDKISTPIKFLISFLLGLLCLFIFRAMLVLWQKSQPKTSLKRMLILTPLISWLLLIIFTGPGKLLIPYNMLVPFMGIQASFLQPLKNALLISSARPNYFIALQLSVFNFLIAFFILFVFIKKLLSNHKTLIILAVWYLVDLIYLYLWNPITSRYFIYLSPVFCIVFCVALDASYNYLARSIKLNSWPKQIILLLILVSLCIPNVLAIRLALFRGKMADVFYTYDYLRAAHLIREDVTENDKAALARREGIRVNNVLPVTFPLLDGLYVSDPDNDNARYVFMQLFNQPSLDIKINQPAQSDDYGEIAYTFDGHRINNAQGTNISLFSQLFTEGLQELRDRRYARAMDLMHRAIKQRPYLLNCLLGNLKLADLQWLTDGEDMRNWINQISCRYSKHRSGSLLKRSKFVSAIINQEIDEYIQCLFYLSFLKYASGDIEKSLYWFSQIRFLEYDYQRLYSWLAQVPVVRSNQQISSFLDSFDQTALYKEPDNYRDRYRFEKFLSRLVF